jgi:hypothetical protein
VPRRGNRLYNNYNIYQSVVQFKIVTNGPQSGPNFSKLHGFLTF